MTAAVTFAVLSGRAHISVSSESKIVLPQRFSGEVSASRGVIMWRS